MTHPRRQRGFTLIEMLTVISIIIIMLAIGIVATSRMYRQTDVNRTEMTLQVLASAYTEYTAQVRQTPGNVNNISYHSNPNNDHVSLQEFLNDVQDNSSVATQMLQTINDQYLVRQTTGNRRITRINDAWGTPIRYYISGSYAHFGLPRRNTPYFASAGENKNWGTINAQNQPDTNAEDNLYSFNLER